MSGIEQGRKLPKGNRGYLLSLSSGTAILALASWLRDLPYSGDLLLYGYLEIVCGLMALTIAACALVRFRGTGDRLCLMLAFGFVLSGVVVTAASMTFFRLTAMDPTAILKAPMAWWLSRTTLAAFLVAALVVGKRLPTARNPGREIAGTLLIMLGLTYLISAVHGQLPSHLIAHEGAPIPRPWNLLPTGIFLVAAVGYRRRLKNSDSAFDRGIYLAAALNVGCHLAATQSERLLDAPFAFAQILKVTSYAVALGGALLDNVRLFDQVQHLATSDALTGLANYRRLVDVLESEIQRSGRTGRPFAVLLLDLDGLKSINDHFGHLVGSQALCCLANILRVYCRSIDTAARYGGDEFALVLPETGDVAAWQVATRICQRLADKQEGPQLFVSVGVAVYPDNGTTIERLLASADKALYRMKVGHKAERSHPGPFVFDRT